MGSAHAAEGPDGSHAHGHGHGHGVPSAPQHALGTALALTSGFMIVEILVGLWSGSLALLADAGHMLGDAGALLLALLMARIATRPRNPRKTYGYRRAEVIGALINALILLVAAGTIVIEAVERLADPPAVRGLGMLIAAAVGLGVNLGSAWVLSSRGGRSINVRGALLHVLGDALGSVAALTAGLLVWTLDWRLADPIASMVIAVLLVSGGLRLLLETTHVLMEGTPEGIDVPGLEQTICETPGVESVHDLHVWSLTPDEPVLTAHVVLHPGSHGTEVARRVGERIREAHGIGHVTIQPESPPPEKKLVPLRIPKNGEGEPGPPDGAFDEPETAT